jgi:hypothetical protein
VQSGCRRKVEEAKIHQERMVKPHKSFFTKEFTRAKFKLKASATSDIRGLQKKSVSNREDRSGRGTLLNRESKCPTHLPPALERLAGCIVLSHLPE